jgi:hypothetical protein
MNARKRQKNKDQLTPSSDSTSYTSPRAVTAAGSPPDCRSCRIIFNAFTGKPMDVNSCGAIRKR